MAASMAENFYAMLLDSASWPEAAMRDYQHSQLARLLAFARANVPFYRTRLDPVFTASGDIDFSRWAELPLVARQDLVDHQAEMQVTDLPPGHGQIDQYRSSGSSGTPISVAVNGLASLADRCARWRAQKAHGVDWSRVNCLRPFTLKHPPDQVWGPPWDRTAQKGRTVVLDRASAPEVALPFLVEKEVRYIHGGGRAFHALAADARRLGIRPQLDMIFTHGEHPEDDDRAICREVFGARMLEVYSSKEGHLMADECPVDGGLHVNDELVLLEILKDDGTPCSVGETGQVVVTPMYNSAQPLIRYAQRDRAEFLPPCSCGRTAPRIRIVGGRAPAMFTHPDGRMLSRVFSTDRAIALGARQFQIAQTGPLAFEFRYVALDDAAPDEAGMQQAFYEHYFADADLRVVRLDRFPPAPGDKHIEYRNEWAARAGGAS